MSGALQGGRCPYITVSCTSSVHTHVRPNMEAVPQTKVWLTISRTRPAAAPKEEQLVVTPPTHVSTYKGATLTEPERDDWDVDRARLVTGCGEALEETHRLLHPPCQPRDRRNEDAFLDLYGSAIIDLHDVLASAFRDAGLLSNPNVGRFTELLMKCVRFTDAPPPSDDETTDGGTDDEFVHLFDTTRFATS